MRNTISLLFFLTTSIWACSNPQSDGHGSMENMRHDEHMMHKEHDMDHADHMMMHDPYPVGVMGSLHHEGFMFSIKHGRMTMDGNILDGDNIATADILQMPNPLGSMPANLSVVPECMDMSMTMVEGMYAYSKNITFMLMGTFMSKDMTLNTYAPMMNRDLLGQFNTSSSDLSELTFSTLFRIAQHGSSQWHGEVAYQKSVGANDQKDMVLTPMNMMMEMVLPYGMQSGDGASRLILGITNTRKINEKLTWGNQLKRNTVLDKKDWSYGNRTELNSWLQYPLNETVNLSSRLKFISQGAISGNSPLISAPVQTANPANYGGEELHLGFGANLKFNIFPGGNDVLGIEILTPLMQDKNNLQMKTDYQVIVGYQKSF